MSIVEQAKSELALIKFGEDDSRVMIEIIEKFLDQWDSGASVSVVLPVLVRCIAGKPLSPLTGDDSEWVEVATGVFQNNRCSTVFKENDRAYNVDDDGRPTISFPYYPEKAEVKFPVYDVGSK